MQTYIQSGNVVLDSAMRSAAKVADAITGAIARELGLDVAVIVRTAAEIDAVLTANPLLAGRRSGEVARDVPRREPAASAVRALVDVDRSPDEFAVVGREVFVHCPNGYGTTKLNNTFFEKQLGVAATTRNWRTVQTLATRAKGSLPNLSINPS